MTLRVGVIGLGVGEQHVRAFGADPSCAVVALCDLDEERLSAARVRWPDARTTTDAAEVLEDPEIDAVSIASYDDAHYAQVVAALRAGKHVFVEKPLCRSRVELAEIARLWREREATVLASNLVLRAAPVYAWLRAQREELALGRVYAFDGDYLYGRLHKITDGWRGDVEDYSVLLGGGVHLVDLMLWITGERPSAVSAAGNRISTEGTAFRYLDFAAATFEFPSGLIGRITANFGSVQPHRHVVRVFGTAATAIVDDAGPRLYRSRDPAKPPQKLDLDNLPASKGALIPSFVERIARDGSAAETQHEFDVISACLAADGALGKGEKVDIDYV
jgi:predicted dehydrogenase